jgi:hypothetical protein
MEFEIAVSGSLGIRFLVSIFMKIRTTISLDYSNGGIPVDGAVDLELLK